MYCSKDSICRVLVCEGAHFVVAVVNAGYIRYWYLHCVTQCIVVTGYYPKALTFICVHSDCHYVLLLNRVHYVMVHHISSPCWPLKVSSLSKLMRALVDSSALCNLSRQHLKSLESSTTERKCVSFTIVFPSSSVSASYSASATAVWKAVVRKGQQEV